MKVKQVFLAWICKESIYLTLSEEGPLRVHFSCIKEKTLEEDGSGVGMAAVPVARGSERAGSPTARSRCDWQLLPAAA